jgi:putative restriction endonuclease
MQWLALRTNDGTEWLTREDVMDFRLDGEKFRLQPTQNGIHKPKGFDAALSIQTVYRRPGEKRPYEDSIGEDGVLRYKWQGTDPNSWDNRSLRIAMEEQVPLLWFIGVGKGPAVFQVVYPIHILWEEPELHQFAIAPTVENVVVNKKSVMEEAIRRYVRVETKRRLHQPVFRSTVLHAYETRCAVCNLGHSVLLDAAHIVPDAHELGIASVVNGIALCKIHHAAFDANILGISPDYVVHIRPDLLEEIDGPMLEHGLKERHGQSLMKLPYRLAERPRTDLLDVSFSRFLAA